MTSNKLVNCWVLFPQNTLVMQGQCITCKARLRIDTRLPGQRINPENDIFSGLGKIRELAIGHGNFRKYLKSQGIYK